MRVEARLQVSIWSDPGWRLLTPDAQRAYLLLLSQPTLTLCGVLAYTPRRWATLAAGDTVERFEIAIAELEERRFVVVDRDTEELLIRSFMRRDRVKPSNPKCWKPAMDQREAIVSPLIAETVTVEVARILAGDENPQGHGASDEARHEPSGEASEKTDMGDGMGSARARTRLSAVGCPLSTVPPPPSSGSAAPPARGEEERVEFLFKVCRTELAKVTPAARDEAAQAAKDLQSVGADVQSVEYVANVIRERHGRNPTPKEIAKRYAELSSATPPSSSNGPGWYALGERADMDYDQPNCFQEFEQEMAAGQESE